MWVIIIFLIWFLRLLSETPRPFIEIILQNVEGNHKDCDRNLHILKI